MSPPASPSEGPSDGFCPVMSVEDALKERCSLLLVDLASAHPSLFLRHQKIIYQHLRRASLSLVAKNLRENHLYKNSLEDYTFLQTQRQGQDVSQEAVAEVPGLDASGVRRDGSRLGTIRFTASCAELNPFLWEVVFSSYEALNPLIPYVHAASQEFALESCLNLIGEVEDRRLVSKCAYNLFVL